MSGASTSLRFDANGLVPAVVQESETGEVLMVAWMNAEALERTLATGLAHFWSRSRRALWQKGETSGHRQHVEAVYADCDGDSLLVLAHQDVIEMLLDAESAALAELEVLIGKPIRLQTEALYTVDQFDVVFM